MVARIPAEKPNNETMQLVKGHQWHKDCSIFIVISCFLLGFLSFLSFFDYFLTICISRAQVNMKPWSGGHTVSSFHAYIGLYIYIYVLYVLYMCHMLYVLYIYIYIYNIYMKRDRDMCVFVCLYLCICVFIIQTDIPSYSLIYILYFYI